jgi:hypothetical protein
VASLATRFERVVEGVRFVRERPIVLGAISLDLFAVLRVGAVNMLFIGASNELGEFESGITAALFGTVPAVVIGGIGTLGVVALWMKLFPPLRGVDRLSDVAAKA